MHSFRAEDKHLALVLLDVQVGVLSRPLSPRTGAAVAAACVGLASTLKSRGIYIVAALTEWSADGGDLPPQTVDRHLPSRAESDTHWSTLIPELANCVDHVVVKRQWGALYGTDLELQFQRRHIRTLVIAGATTNFSIESTGRQAWERGFNLLFVENASTSIDTMLHEFSFTHILPRLGHVISSGDLTAGRWAKPTT